MSQKAVARKTNKIKFIFYLNTGANYICKKHKNMSFFLKLVVELNVYFFNA